MRFEMRRVLATACCLALILICLGWELAWAPLRPGGSWIALKALPLAFSAPGLAAGRRYTAQWTSFLALAYFSEGVVRAWSETGLSRSLALAEIALSLGLFAICIALARARLAAANR